MRAQPTPSKLASKVETEALPRAASGEMLLDQHQFTRCDGFDALEIDNEPTLASPQRSPSAW